MNLKQAKTVLGPTLLCLALAVACVSSGRRSKRCAIGPCPLQCTFGNPCRPHNPWDWWCSLHPNGCHGKRSMDDGWGKRSREGASIGVSSGQLKQQQLDPSYTFERDDDSTETLDSISDEGKHQIFDQQDSGSQLQADGAEGQADRRLSVAKRMWKCPPFFPC